MAKIKISAMVPETRELNFADPTGETWVKIRPPGYEEEIERARLTSKRSYSYDDGGYLVTHVDANLSLLRAEELWLTYESTNLDVELDRGDGEIEDITFKPRGQTNRQEFMETLAKLPSSIVNEWHAMVMDVVKGWGRPF